MTDERWLRVNLQLRGNIGLPECVESLDPDPAALSRQFRRQGGNMNIAAVGLVLALASPPADVTGKWEGKISTTDGSGQEDTALLILTQKDTAITGTVGGSETDQHKITSGRIADNKITIKVTTPNGGEITLELTVENDEMKGSITAGERQGKLHVKRIKK